MTVNGVCHALWEDQGQTHLCGKPDEHNSWHQCACGALLFRGASSLTDEQRHMRSVDCPQCLAKAGRPCHHKQAVMTGVHAERQAKAGRP